MQKVITVNSQPFEVLAYQIRTAFKKELNVHAASSLNLQKTWTDDQLFCLVKILENNYKTKKDLDTFLNFMNKSKITSSPSFLQQNYLNSKKMEPLLQGLLLRGGIDTVKDKRYWLKLLKALIRKYGALGFLLLLLLLAIINRKTISSFLQQLPNLLEKLINFFNGLKNKNTVNLEIINNIHDIINDTSLKPEVIVNNNEFLGSIEDALNTIREIPLQFNHDDLQKMCEDLMGENYTSDEFEKCMEDMVKLFIFRACSSEAFKFCQYKLITYYENLMKIRCSNIIDILAKDACAAKIVRRAITRFLERCFLSDNLGGCETNYYNLRKNA